MGAIFKANLRNPPNLRKILSHDGFFSEIIIAQHAQLNRHSLLIACLIMVPNRVFWCVLLIMLSGRKSTVLCCQRGANGLLCSFIRNGTY